VCSPKKLLRGEINRDVRGKKEKIKKGEGRGGKKP